MKHTITIDVEIPEGYEPVIKDGKGQFRPASDDEHYLSMYGTVLCGGNCDSRIILRKSWQPPSWIQAMADAVGDVWVYQNYDNWFVSDANPEGKGPNFCHQYGSKSVHCETLAALYGETFTAPPVDKVQIRHGKVEARDD